MNDPIVDDIHRVREQIMREHDNDLHKLFEHLRERQVRSKKVIVSRPLRRPDRVQPAARS